MRTLNCKAYRSRDGYATWTEIDGQLNTVEYCGLLIPAHKITRAVRKLIDAYKTNCEAIEIGCDECESNSICNLGTN